MVISSSLSGQAIEHDTARRTAETTMKRTALGYDFLFIPPITEKLSFSLKIPSCFRCLFAFSFWALCVAFQDSAVGVPEGLEDGADHFGAVVGVGPGKSLEAVVLVDEGGLGIDSVLQGNAVGTVLAGCQDEV